MAQKGKVERKEVQEITEEDVGEIEIEMRVVGEEGAEEVWNGSEFVTMETLLETVQSEIPQVKSMKKEELAKQILKGLTMLPGGKIPAVQYEQISKDVKKANEVNQGPSLFWMISDPQNYLKQVKIEGRRTFYVVTRKGAEFATFDTEIEEQS